MRRIFAMIVCLMALLFPVTVDAAIEAKNTHVVTVTADVPAGFGRPITIIYKEAGSDGWQYEIKLTEDNNYSFNQRLEEGSYQCVSREADNAVVTSEESLQVYSDMELLVSVVDERESSNVAVVEPVVIQNVEPVSYAWVKPAVIGIIALGVMVISVILLKK